MNHTITSKTAQFKEWQQSELGGGGFITGLTQHPTDPHILYARCDVAGVFKSEDGGKSWRAINKGMQQSHDHSVHTLAISLQRPDILFRGAGEAKDHKVVGNIHKSVDGGETWYKVCEGIGFYGNGMTRAFAETIVVDEKNPNFVIAGGYGGGVWVSHDEGENWQFSGLSQERISTVAIHPLDSSRIYVGTIGDATTINAWSRTYEEAYSYNSDEIEQKIVHLRDQVRGSIKGKLYGSSDGGVTWDILTEDCDFSRILFDPVHVDTMYAACFWDRIRQSTDGGRCWTGKSAGLEDLRYHTLERDPQDRNVFYTTTQRYFEGAPIPLYRSTDSCETWELIRWHQDGDVMGLPDYMNLNAIGINIAKVKVDIHNPMKLFICNWYGVNISEDGGLTWNAHQYKGLEVTCVDYIVAHPTEPNRVYIALSDYVPKKSNDNGESYRKVAAVSDHNVSTAIALSSHRKDFMLYGVKKGHRLNGSIVRSEDNGETVQAVMEFEGYQTIQGLVEDKLNPGIFYAYVDGWLVEGAGLYKSQDWGLTWSKLPFELPTYIETLPHNKLWVEEEMLPCVVYQTKNSCGSNQLMCTDPHQKDTIYVGEWSEGLYKSEDGGQTWRNIGHGLPFQRHKASILVAIKVDEQTPGTLYAGFIREGLWRSEDGGLTWHKLFPSGDELFNASSIVVGGYDADELFVACEPLYWSPCDSAVYYSSDKGQTWKRIYSGELGAMRWKGITVEKQSGRLHAITCGNGVLYVDRNHDND